jgi:hypothetical protein
MEDVIKRYRDEGITCKILYSEHPIYMYLVSKECLVDNVVQQGKWELDGEALFYENKKMVSLRNHNYLNVYFLNITPGIIVTKPKGARFKYTLIPIE